MNTKEYILHIDTSTKVCSVALSKNGELVAFKDSGNDQYKHGEILTLFIDELLKNAQVEMKDLTAVSVASGPGSYTGLRIGASTAKGLCYALKIPLIAIDSLSALFALLEKPATNVCSMIDARRMEVFSAIFDAEGNKIKDISADILDEESYREFEPLLCIGDATNKMVDVWKDRNIQFQHEIDASAKGQVHLAFEKFKKEEFEDVAYFEPFYLKDFLAIPPKSQKIS